MTLIDSSLKVYLKNIAKYPLLSREQEIIYAQQLQEYLNLENKIQSLKFELKAESSLYEILSLIGKEEYEIKVITNNGKIAKNMMIASNLRLVVFIARKYKIEGMELLDLIQEGNLGLCRGVEKFDPKKGYRLSNYIYWWIKQGITRAIEQKSRLIYLPKDLLEKIRKISMAINAASKLEAGFPSLIDISKTTGLEIDKIKKYLKFSGLRKVRSLDIQVGNEEKSTLVELIASSAIELKQEVETDILIDNLHNFLSELTKEQICVLVLKYGLGGSEALTYSKITKKLGYKLHVIQKIEAEAMNILQKKFQF